MEDVAGKAERLAKDRAKKDPPPPFRKRVTPSLYSRTYSTDGREARNKRAQQRAVRATGIDKLGKKEYMKLLQEVDLMMQTPVNIEELINKRMKEIEECLAAEQQEREAAEWRETRSQASKASTSKATDIGPVPAQRSSPRKWKTDAELKKDTGDKRSKTDDTDDASNNRKWVGVKRPKQKKTGAIPMLMDDDDNDDLMVIDDKDKDKDYKPQPEEDDNDIYPMDDDDDDDFQEPPPRARKSVDKASTVSKKPTKTATDRRVNKSTQDKEGDADDETISLFQKIMGPDFEVRASEEFEDNTRDKCGNPVEAAGFRATMKMLPILGKEAMEAAAEAIHKLPKILLADTKKQLKNLFEHTMQAHQHAAEASKCLKELHDKLPLDVFLRIADSAVWPLVILHIPKTEAVIQKLKETAMERTQRKRKEGSTDVTDVMIDKNLPQRGDWMTEEEYRPRKMIASILYKYIWDEMFKETTVTQIVVDEFKLPKTTIHRQIYGKKYPGGGQTLEKLRKSDMKAEASGSGTEKIAVIFMKPKIEDKTKSKKGKGPGKNFGQKEICGGH